MVLPSDNLPEEGTNVEIQASHVTRQSCYNVHDTSIVTAVEKAKYLQSQFISECGMSLANLKSVLEAQECGIEDCLYCVCFVTSREFLRGARVTWGKWFDVR